MRPCLEDSSGWTVTTGGEVRMMMETVYLHRQVCSFIYGSAPLCLDTEGLAKESVWGVYLWRCLSVEGVHLWKVSSY